MDAVNETIYNLLDQLPKCSPCQSTRSKNYYRSIYAPNNITNDQHSHRTMGPAIVPRPDPSHPLRRRQNYIELPEIIPFTRVHRMPPIPKANEQLIDEFQPSKNFIKENKNKIIHSLPTCPRRYIVSDKKGNKFLINGSGLQKDYIYKKNYGKIPSYLQTRKTFDDQSPCNSNDPQMIMLPPEERLCLIYNLKDRYEEIFSEYQRLPLLLETTSTIMKKGNLTNDLVNIERDIDFLEKHHQIFIINNYPDIKN